MKSLEHRREDFLMLLELENFYGDHGHQPAIWKAFADECSMSLEDRLWLCFLAVGYSHEGSTWCAIYSPGVWLKKRLPPADLKLAILRRNLYGGRILGHFADLYSKGSFSKWLDIENATWKSLLRQLRQIDGNGSWAAYTTAETIITVCGLDICVDHSGFADNTGPKATLLNLGFEASEKGAEEFIAWVRTQQPEACEIFLLETVMCYWQNMCKGKFYPGRSIDRQQNQIEYARDKGHDVNALWRARRTAFRIETLGEVQGWPGLDKERLKHYNRTGQILSPIEMRTRCL